MTDRVAVVGGGAVGVTAARDLATRGADVTLYERGDLASGASGRAAGIVYDAFAEDRDAAIADRALSRFRDLDASGAIEFTPCPYVWFAREGDDTAADAIRRQVPRMRAHDRNVELLDPSDLAERFPALETADVAVAAVATDAGYLDTESYVVAMAKRASDAGAIIRTRTEAAIRVRDGGVAIKSVGGVQSYDSVLVAAGAHSKRLLADTGFAVAMKPYRVQALVTEPLVVMPGSGGDQRVPMAWDATESFYFRPFGAGVLVGDGTEEAEFDPDDYDETADSEFREVSRRRVHEVLRLAGGADADEVTIQRAWAGLCTATPDRNPLLGPVHDAEDVFVATGWHGHGFMRSPALGEAVAEQILGGEGIEAFDPRRFDGDEEFRVIDGMTVEE